ncbi:MAG: hypothetical protein NPIRA01_20760 [Nitrospirales bacterium]|nr:MAG: hypothetical protein NPIRA01_20760 [Nitrospirales bacterium]
MTLDGSQKYGHVPRQEMLLNPSIINAMNSLSESGQGVHLSVTKITKYDRGWNRTTKMRVEQL